MFVLKATQQVRVTVQFQDKKGNPAEVQGTPAWTVSDPNTLTVTPDADGMGAEVVAGNLGTAQVNVTADADLGDGTTEIMGTLEIEVKAGDATVVSLNPETPTDQP